MNSLMIPFFEDAADAPLPAAFKAQAPVARVADAVSGKLHGVALPILDLLNMATLAKVIQSLT